MNDSQFSNFMGWIGERIGDFFSLMGAGMSEMNQTHWFIGLIMTVVIGFMCLKGLGANQRM